MPKLIVKDGDRVHLVDLAVGETLVLGRSHDCDIAVMAARASRRHASFVAVGSEHHIADLGSTNGTLLNGAPFETQVRLADRDTVDAGGCEIIYRTDP